MSDCLVDWRRRPSLRASEILQKCQACCYDSSFLPKGNGRSLDRKGTTKEGRRGNHDQSNHASQHSLVPFSLLLVGGGMGVEDPFKRKGGFPGWFTGGGFPCASWWRGFDEGGTEGGVGRKGGMGAEEKQKEIESPPRSESGVHCPGGPCASSPAIPF